MDLSSFANLTEGELCLLQEQSLRDVSGRDYSNLYLGVITVICVY